MSKKKAKAAKKREAKKSPIKLVKSAKAAKAAKAATNGSGRTAPRKSSPRSQVLPGMEQVRNRSLDRLCESLGDTRDEIARLADEEDGLQASAMGVMQRDGVTAYRHAGIELALVPGGAKLRVRKLKDKTEQSASGGVTANPDKADEAGVTADEVAEDSENAIDDEIVDEADL